MHALILADGDAPTRTILDATWSGWADDVALVIAADGGARHASELGVPIDRWVGDGDSVTDATLAALLDAGVGVDRAPIAKDESDAELAVAAALAAGARRITIVGALGGRRFDHALANVGLLSMPELVGLDVRIVTGTTRLRLLAGPGHDGSPVGCELSGRVGDIISLLPFGEDVTGVTTRGLRYPLHDEPLLVGRTRGLSNVREAMSAFVTLRTGRLLVVESATL